MIKKKKKPDVFFIGFIIVTLLLTSPVNVDFSYIPRFLFLQISLLAGLICLFIYAERRSARFLQCINSMPFSAAVPAFIMLTLFIWSGVSVVWAVNKTAAAAKAGTYFSYALFCGILSFCLRGRILSRRIIYIFAPAGLLISIPGIFQYFGFNLPWVYQAAPPASFFANRNLASLAAAFTLPVSLYLFLTARKKRYYCFYACGVCSVMLYVFIARSRSVWIGCGAAAILCAAVFLQSRRLYTRLFYMTSEKSAFFLAVIAAALFCATFKPHPDVYGVSQKFKYYAAGTAASVFQDGADKGRLLFYRTTLKMIAARPLTGMGADNWWVYFPKYSGGWDDYSKRPRRTHNDVLQNASELGIPAGAAYGLLLILPFLYIFKRKKRFSVVSNGKKSVFVSDFFTMPSAIIYFADSMFSFPGEQVFSNVLFLTLCVWQAVYGSSSANKMLSETDQFHSEKKTLVKTKWRTLILIILIILQFFQTVYTGFNHRTDYTFFILTQPVENSEEGIENFTRAVRIRGQRFYYRNYELYEEIAKAAHRLDVSDVSLAYYIRLLDIDPWNISALFNLAMLSGHMESRDSMHTLLMRVLSVNPKYIPAHRALFHYYTEENEMEKALYHLNVIDSRKK